MVDLRDVVGNLERLGFFDFVLPWLLFFAVVLGILNKTAILGSDKKLNAIIAAAIAFFVVNFTPIGGIAAFYSNIFGMSAQVLATLFVFVLFAGVLGYKPENLVSEHKTWAYLVIAVLLAVVSFAVFSQAGGGFSSLGLDNDMVTLILVLAFVLAVIFFAAYPNGGGAAEHKTEPTKQE